MTSYIPTISKNIFINFLGNILTLFMTEICLHHVAFFSFFLKTHTKMACNDYSRNHVTAQDHVTWASVETHPLIYEVLGYVTQHFVEIPQANHEYSRYSTWMLTK